MDNEADPEPSSSKTLHIAGVAFVSLALAFVVLKGLSWLGGGGAAAEVQAPILPDVVAAAPEFHTADGLFPAGVGFCVRLEESPRRVLLTALHLFGPLGGMPAALNPAELPGKVQRVDLKNPFAAGASLGTAGPPLVVSDAAHHPQSAKSGDVAAFWVSADAQLQALEPALRAPKVGDPVWVVAPAESGAPAESRLHPAWVTASDENFLDYRFVHTGLRLRSASGAPVVNAAGKLVGLHLGQDHSSGATGFANPWLRFRDSLRRAVASASAPAKKPPPEKSKTPPIRTPPPPPPGG